MNAACSRSPRTEEVHGSQDEIPGIVHRLGHAVQERLAGRGGVPLPGQLADFRGHQRPGPGRHHRREPDAEP